MTGYRCGFVCAAPAIAGALQAFRPSVGTAPQEFVQRAGLAALGDEKHVEAVRELYRAQARDAPAGARAARAPAGGRRGDLLPLARRRRPIGGRSPAGCSSTASSSRPGSFFGAGRRGVCEDGARADPGRLRARRRDPRGGAVTTDETIAALDRGEVRVAEPAGDEWVVHERGAGGDPRLLPHAADGAARGRAVRVPRQDPAQVRLRGARRPRRAAGGRALRLVPLARRDPDAVLREHRRLGRARDDGRHLGDGRLRRADRRRTSTSRAASGSAACSSRRARGR